MSFLSPFPPDSTPSFPIPLGSTGALGWGAARSSTSLQLLPPHGFLPLQRGSSPGRSSSGQTWRRTGSAPRAAAHHEGAAPLLLSARRSQGCSSRVHLPLHCLKRGFFPFVNRCLRRCHSGGWGAQLCPAPGPRGGGAGGNQLCLAWGSPGRSLQSPPCSFLLPTPRRVDPVQPRTATGQAWPADSSPTSNLNDVKPGGLTWTGAPGQRHTWHGAFSKAPSEGGKFPLPPSARALGENLHLNRGVSVFHLNRVFLLPHPKLVAGCRSAQRRKELRLPTHRSAGGEQGWERSVAFWDLVSLHFHSKNSLPLWCLTKLAISGQGSAKMAK